MSSGGDAAVPGAAGAPAGPVAASGGGAAAATGPEALDPTLVATHTYLGGTLASPEWLAAVGDGVCDCQWSIRGAECPLRSTPRPADVDDLAGGATGLLEEGETYRLPVLPLDGLVLCPGNTLPLRLTFRGDRALVQARPDALIGWQLG